MALALLVLLHASQLLLAAPEVVLEVLIQSLELAVSLVALTILFDQDVELLIQGDVLVVHFRQLLVGP